MLIRMLAVFGNTVDGRSKLIGVFPIRPNIVLGPINLGPIYLGPIYLGPFYSGPFYLGPEDLGPRKTVDICSIFFLLKLHP